jgi:sugar/nucleoside kinase (ribokinase family)
MELSRALQDVLQSLRQREPREFSVAVMPDFFLDRLVVYKGGVEDLSKTLTEVAGRKGGGVHGIRQLELRGGNASNTASALAALGVKVHPIIHTSALGFHLLKFYLEPLGVDLSRVKAQGELAITTALEVDYGSERANIMMSDLGSLPDFGPEDLTAHDRELLQKVDYVCVFNWASTRRWGTELAEKVFGFAKSEGRGKTYYDTSDPLPNKEAIPKLVKHVLSGSLIDILSVNENEAFCYASQLDGKIVHTRKLLRPDDSAKECARTLAKNLSARIDIHTTTMAGSFQGESEIIVPTFRVPVLRVTGAGDAWNAGNIFGDALNLSTQGRLALANAIAAYYISNPAGEHPTLSKLVDFIHQTQSTTQD